MAKKKKSRNEVVLPWESKSPFISELLSGRRWWPLFVLFFLFTVLFLIVEAADYRARVRITRATIAEVHRAVGLFRLEVGRCPHTATELIHPPRASAHYLDELPDDGWGNSLFIRCLGGKNSKKIQVISAGPSGSLAEDDNIF